MLLIITVISAGLRTSIPYYYKLVVDGLEAKTPLTEMKLFISIIIILSVSRFVVYTYFQSNRAMMNMKFQWQVRRRAFKSLMEAGRLKFQHLNIGEIVTRLSDDTEKLTWFLSSGIFRGFDAILIFVFTVWFLYYMSPFLTLVTVITLSLMVVFMFLFDGMLKKAFQRLQISISRTNDFIHSSLSGISIVKSYNREDDIASYFKDIVKNRKREEIHVVRLEMGTRGVYMTLHALSTVTVLAVGGVMKINGTISLGTLVAFLALIKNIINPVLDIGTLFVRGRRAAVSSTRIYEIEKLGKKVRQGGSKAVFNEKIQLKKVSFQFQGHEILKEIDLTISKGEKVAVMGTIGSGKSFLSRIIAGVEEASGGEILLDGKPVSSYSSDSYRKLTGYASQVPVVFSDTIRNNIIMGKTFDEERFERAVETSQLKEEMQKFNLGSDTVIGPKGKTLSGGQKQRLALARALYSSPELLVLDDITSALDAETEMSLWRDLFKEIPDQTLLLVTHRPFTAMTADKIIVMENGTVAESGTHDELMEGDSLYREIYDHEHVKD